MMNEPLVSIGVPVYNGGDYLEEGLRSIQNQNYKNWECQIINNASTDNTGEVAQRFVNEDKRFKFHFDTLLAYHAMNLADVGFVFKVLSYTRWHPEALTSKICVKYNTFLNAKERRLFQFKDYLPEYQKEYKKHRLSYAYFIAKKKVLNQKDCVAWHNGYLTRKFTRGEVIKGILHNNGMTYKLKKLFAS